jgi:DNA-binding NarL/FixJ family response regulator
MAVDEVGSSEEALRRMARLRPDLMFVDIRLPGQNGLDLAREVKKDDTELTGVILANYDSPEFREAAFRYGVNYLFSKSTSSVDEIRRCGRCKPSSSSGGEGKSGKIPPRSRSWGLN